MKWNQFVTLALSVLFLGVIFVGCSQKEDNDKETPTTGTWLVENGKTDYRIVLGEDAGEDEQYAAEELQYFFEKATGIELRIIDDVMVSDAKGKYLSIGNTVLIQENGIELNYDELGNDGYKVVTCGDAIVMAGATGYGTKYSVYGFLNQQFGLKIYTEDVFYIDETENEKLVDLNWTDVPDIPFRSGGITLGYWGTEKYMTRMRIRNISDGWGLSRHTHFIVIDPYKYSGEQYDDWFSEQKKQLCLTNEDMKAEFVKNLWQIIQDESDCTYFMLGHEDNDDYCKCTNCKQARAANGGFQSAVEMIFTNDVVRQINELAEKFMPERELLFATFAYTNTERAPVVFNRDLEKYVPINENVVAEDNLAVMVAPISAHASSPYLSDDNPARGTFLSWDAVTNHLMVWAYSANFANYLVPYNCWDSIQQNYLDYKDMNVSYVFEQGLYNVYVPNFQELRGYVYYNTMWDTSLDTNGLIQDFITHFYGAGANKVQEYFDKLRGHMDELEATRNIKAYSAPQLVQNYLDTTLFPKEFLDECDALFDDALEAVEEMRNTNMAEYERCRNAVRAERMQVRYLILSLYADKYSKADFNAMVDEFEDIASIKKFQYYDEGRNLKVSDLIAGWKNL
jgi:lipoprotein